MRKAVRKGTRKLNNGISNNYVTLSLDVDGSIRVEITRSFHTGSPGNERGEEKEWAGRW